ncbi:MULTISPECIES: DUF370 domain-containing protein [Leptospira]|uniref:Putative regulatory protein LBJ_1616 n=11 Tax=Leptospira TaxID=171 RepID=Y1616_LEPBJ|nr:MULTISPECIES: DUF370 domain-containing protein [Leptospira]Q04SE4.1 RecName: Full=Putative regulatory protein LBJ_1616 [Leptospira borgpetersenii serovar Hardjo-bovis str. JB197]Q050H2.1 RecName: Full=Putative regulatory protein LBL_1834 [Leptospira borgpetersenii serovar Hardjo-bovis str. L550]EMF99858.1 PF04025 domain protein [Leptospira borgpetersenii str. 200701203]EMO07874.1 PF04025 domain protein [Leptospira borgpetersenii str. Noumea 25]EMO63851.1 PF04025 domain protein [Leptospira b
MSQFSVLNVGFGNIVLVSKIVSIIHSDSASAKRIRNEAKSNNSLIDATQGKKTRSIIVTDSNHLILSNLRVESLAKRIESSDNSIASEEEDLD